MYKIPVEVWYSHQHFYCSSYHYWKQELWLIWWKKKGLYPSIVSLWSGDCLQYNNFMGHLFLQWRMATNLIGKYWIVAWIVNILHFSPFAIYSCSWINWRYADKIAICGQENLVHSITSILRINFQIQK